MTIDEHIIDAACAGRDDDVRAALARAPRASRESLAIAAAVADEEAALSLLDADASLATRAVGRRSWTPLLYLCCSRYRRQDPEATAARVKIARRLIELGADVMAVGFEPGLTAQAVNMVDDEHSWRPVEAAAGRLASPEIVRLLLDAKADLEQTDTTLANAVRGGNLEVLQILLDGPHPWWQVIWALKAAVVLERRDMAQRLVAKASAPKVLAPGLMEAIRRGRDADFIELLLGDDSEPDLSRPVWEQAYKEAVRYGHRGAIERIQRRGLDDSALTMADRVIGAAVMGDDKALRQLIAAPGWSAKTLTDRDHQMLAWAIREGRLAVVPLLLEAGFDPNVADNDGDTPLHLAVRAGSLDLVDTLIRAGARVDERNFDGRTPLALAGALPESDARRQLTKRLLDAGAAPSAAADESGLDREARDRLFERAADAVVFGELDTLRDLLDQSPWLVHARSPRPHRATLLHYSGANGTEHPRMRTPENAPAIAQLLLERGADVNARCKLYGGAKTLGLLLTSGVPRNAGLDGELIRVLARGGANVTDPGVITTAIMQGSPRAVQTLAELGAPVDTLFVAAALDRLDLLETLLAGGADINERFDTGYTALHAAAVMGNARAVELLLDKGADHTLREYGWSGTAADVAYHSDHLPIRRLIQKRTKT